MTIRVSFRLSSSSCKVRVSYASRTSTHSSRTSTYSPQRTSIDWKDADGTEYPVGYHGEWRGVEGPRLGSERGPAGEKDRVVTDSSDSPPPDTGTTHID